MKTDLKERMILAAVTTAISGAGALCTSRSVSLAAWYALLAGYATFIIWRPR